MSILTLPRSIKSAAIIIALTALSSPMLMQAQIGLHADLNGDNTVNISDVSVLIGTIMNRTSDPAVEAGLCPNSFHPHLIDLGLQSGIKWACCNVGAKNPIEFGDYYAWGEVTTKDDYSIDNYYWYDSNANTYTSIGDDIAGNTCDVAYVKWGHDYSMPTSDQFKELIARCLYQRVTINGVVGGKFTGPTSNSIFIPFAGCQDENGTNCVGSEGNYWSSTVTPTEEGLGYGSNILYINSSRANVGTHWRQYVGRSIRPIEK